MANPRSTNPNSKSVDALFGQSYYLRFDSKLWDALQPFPPLGSLYAASAARQAGYSVALFDAMLAENTQAWAAALDKYRPRFAFIYEDNFNYLSKMCLLNMREAAFEMSQMAKERDFVEAVIVCGSDATDQLEAYFAHGVDYALLGEGENTLVELLGALTEQPQNGLDLIRGLAWPNAAGAITRTLPRAFERDVDKFAFPAWDLVDIPHYKQVWYERHGHYSMNLVTTRGCPYSCNWCAKPIYGQRYNARSPENVADEVKWLHDNFQPGRLWFADDILGLKPHWLERFAEELRQRGVKVPFKCLQRADLVTPTTAKALAAAGCKIVWMGAESGSQRILDAMDKGQTVDEIYTATRLLHENEIQVGFFIQFGYSGETFEDIDLTLKMIRAARPDDIGISVSYPLPGTKFYERVYDQLGEKQNWTDSNDLALLYEGTYAPEFYRVLHRRVHHEFRLRKAWELVRESVLRPAHWRPQLVRKVASIPYHRIKWAQTETKLRKLARQPKSIHSLLGVSA